MSIIFLLPIFFLGCSTKLEPKKSNKKYSIEIKKDYKKDLIIENNLLKTKLLKLQKEKDILINKNNNNIKNLFVLDFLIYQKEINENKNKKLLLENKNKIKKLKNIKKQCDFKTKKIIKEKEKLNKKLKINKNKLKYLKNNLNNDLIKLNIQKIINEKNLHKKYNKIIESVHIEKNTKINKLELELKLKKKRKNNKKTTINIEEIKKEIKKLKEDIKKLKETI